MTILGRSRLAIAKSRLIYRIPAGEEIRDESGVSVGALDLVTEGGSEPITTEAGEVLEAEP